MHPGQDTYWPDFGEKFDRSVANPIWRRYSDSLVRDWIVKHLPAAPLTTVLKTDLFEEAVGAGTYPLLESVSEHVFAIDLSASVCRRAVCRYKDLFVSVSDVRQLAFRPASFDLIVSISTLDHFENQRHIQAALDQLFSALKPGGVLLVTLDNPANPVVRFRNAMPWRVLKRLGLVPYPTGATMKAEEFQKAAGTHRLPGLGRYHAAARAAIRGRPDGSPAFAPAWLRAVELVFEVCPHVRGAGAVT